jgi:hypothetical protein
VSIRQYLVLARVESMSASLLTDGNEELGEACVTR